MDKLDVDPVVLSTAVAVGIGLLVGSERERSKGSGPDREIAGVRTFTLVALLGVFAKLLDEPAAFAVIAVSIALIALAGYLQTSTADPGITTEIALLATFALGALSLAHPAYSAGAAVVLTILLASRSWLHEMVKARLSDRELHDALLLLAAALVVLPLLPDRTLDPLQAINPRKLWLVVVLIMSLNAVAYVALRLLGPRKGLLLAGLLGGFVSSVSTHAAMGQRTKAQPSLSRHAAAAANLSSVATAVLLFIVLSAVHMELAMQLAGPCIAAGGVAAACGTLLLLRTEDTAPAELPLGRPLSLRAALTFGIIVAVVLFCSALLARTLGPGGALAGIAAAGFADAHSAAISAAVLDQRDVLSATHAQLGVMLAVTTNATVKVIVSWVSGTHAYAWHVSYGVLASLGAAWGAWLLLL